MPTPPPPPKQNSLTSAFCSQNLLQAPRFPHSAISPLVLPLPSPPRPVNHNSLWQGQCALFPHPPSPNTSLSHCLSFLSRGLLPSAEALSHLLVPQPSTLRSHRQLVLATDGGGVPLPLGCLMQTSKEDLALCKVWASQPGSELYMCYEFTGPGTQHKA